MSDREEFGRAVICTCCGRTCDPYRDWDGTYSSCGDCAWCASLEHEPCCHGSCKGGRPGSRSHWGHKIALTYMASPGQRVDADGRVTDLYTEAQCPKRPGVAGGPDGVTRIIDIRARVMRRHYGCCGGFPTTRRPDYVLRSEPIGED